MVIKTSARLWVSSGRAAGYRALLVLLLAVLLLIPDVGIARADGEYLPPTETVSPPNTSDCPQASLPPPPVDLSEAVAPGETSPAPLPVPTPAVGGTELSECGFVLPEGAGPLPIDISAAAWLIADLDTGEVVAAKDPHGRYRPASTLKLLTALTILEQLPDLSAVVVGTQEDANQEGSRVGIGPGGEYTVKQLLMFMMMGSGNDTAFALARANGGFDKTVADMNRLATQLGALDTRAVTVSGLDGPGQMTSVYDLALIARAAMQHPEFPELVSTKSAQVPGYGKYEAFGIANDNQLLHRYPGALGGKTGFTDDAGNTYVGMAEKDGRRLVVTMLAGTQRPRRQWMQAASLLDWAFAVPVDAGALGSLVAMTEPTGESPAATTGLPPTQSAPLVATTDSSDASSATPTSISLSGSKPASTEGSKPSSTVDIAAPDRADSESPTAVGALSVVIYVGGALILLGALLWFWSVRRRAKQVALARARARAEGRLGPRRYGPSR